MAAGPRLTIPCSPTLHEATKQAAKNDDLALTEYVRQSIRLRKYLDDNGWSRQSVASAREFLREGAWRDY